MIAETLITHGSDFIEWIDAAGLVQSRPERLSPRRLAIELIKAPRDLRVVHKDFASALLRVGSDVLHRTVRREASADDMKRPAQESYEVLARVSDPSGQFLPRGISLTCGGGTPGHSVNLFRSPLGTRLDSAGGLYGRAMFESGGPAAWCKIRARVTPTISPKRAFEGQADANGDFLIALSGLPLAVPEAEYAITVNVLVAPTSRPDVPSDHADWVPWEILANSPQGDGINFQPFLHDAIRPGRLVHIVSHGESHVILKPLQS